MLARFDPLKDHPTMLRAFRFLLDAGEPVRLHLFGDGPESLKQENLALARDLDLDAAIVWHGDVEDPMTALGGVDILVSSSISEGMSNAVLEGMAAGRVVVSTDVGDARALLAGPCGMAGYVAPPSDPAALAAAIRSALTRPAEALARAATAREITKTRHGTEALLDRYEGLYRRIVAGEPLELPSGPEGANFELLAPEV
jgi:glycosyltransferase involved in cell wall biosynthesis